MMGCLQFCLRKNVTKIRFETSQIQLLENGHKKTAYVPRTMAVNGGGDRNRRASRSLGEGWT